MIRRPPRSTPLYSSAASDVYKRQDIWYHLNARPIISYASNAVINKEGEKERIDHWVNKNWKIGGDVHAPMEDKLKFLYEIGRREQVGMYLRNQNIVDKLFQDLYKKRAECEKTVS